MSEGTCALRVFFFLDFRFVLMWQNLIFICLERHEVLSWPYRPLEPGESVSRAVPTLPVSSRT